MSEVDIKISELIDNPWRFKVISSKDFDNLVKTVTTYGSHATNPILVAVIERKYYIVDGHARRDAIQQAGFDKARCIIAEWIRNFSDIRVWSFRLNRHGHYNPLELLRMVKEDIKTLGNVKKVAAHYCVSDEYVSTLLRLDALDESAKVMVDKVIDIARKRYQFVLEQISAYHLAGIAELEPAKQLEVLEWLFHDIMYGPPNESLISLPSVYEILSEIERHRSHAASPNAVRKKYKTKDHSLHTADQLEFRCSCGNKFYVDFSAGRVSEYVEQDSVIIKKEVEVSQVSHAEEIKSRRSAPKRLSIARKIRSFNT